MAKAGPDRHGWAKWEFWRGFNIQVDVPNKVCLGCLTTDDDGDEGEDDDQEE